MDEGRKEGRDVSIVRNFLAVPRNITGVEIYTSGKKRGAIDLFDK